MTAAVRVPMGGGALERAVRAVLAVPGIYLLLAVIFAATWAIVAVDGGSLDVRSLLVVSVALGITAAGQTAAIIAGSIDLSVVPTITISAMLAARYSDGQMSQLAAGIGAALGAGVVIGLVNGLLVSRANVSGFVATLGTSLVITGILADNFAQGASEAMPGRVVELFTDDEIGPVPVSVVLLVAVALAVGLLLTRTRIGAHVYAVGGDADVARLSGVRTGRGLVTAHVVSGVCAAIAGIYLASRLGTPNLELGRDGNYDLESIAVVVLGGTALAGGRGRVNATMAAVLVFALLDRVFNQLEIDPFLKPVVRGVIIIAAVASYTLRSREEAA